MKTTDFKDRAIDELIDLIPSDRSSAEAFLSAAAKITGAIDINKKRLNLVFNLDSYEKAVAVVTVLKTLYPSDFELSTPHSKASGKRASGAYSVTVPSLYAKEALIDFRLMVGGDDVFTGFSDGIPNAFITRPSLAAEYLKGLFFASGSVYVPSVGVEEKKGGYHFEIQTDDEYFAECVQHFLLSFDIAAKINNRPPHFLIYIKDKDEILRLLGTMGLVESGLRLKSIIDERETANVINRASICETANLDKTYAASSKYIVAIEKISELYGLNSLTEELRHTAEIRTEFPELSLQELADELSVTKSCLNHRLRKLLEIAESIKV